MKKSKFTNEQVLTALNLKFKPKDPDSGAKSVREYMQMLLAKLWWEDEGFSGKRPFGNSSWQNDMVRLFVKSGVIAGTFDDDGCLEDYDGEDFNELIQLVIVELCRAPA